MRTTLSFLSVKDFWDVEPGKTAPFFELGPTTRTYEKNIGISINPTNKNQVIWLFSNKEQNTTVPLDDATEKMLWDIGSFVVEQVNNGVVTSNQRDFHLLLNTTFGETHREIRTGEHLRADDKYCPTFIEWEDIDRNRYVLYLSNRYFSEGYRGGELFVVPLIDNTEFWFTSKENVESELKRFTPAKHVDHVNRLSLREDGTYATTTSVSSIKIRWYERNNVNNIIDTEWYIGVYGVAKNNPEDIKIAIREYLLNSSQRPENEWLSIFPEIFNPVEFTLVPFWGQYASAPSEDMAIHQPIVRLKDALPLFKRIAVDYPAEHVEEYLEIIPSLKHSISIMSVGAVGNDNNRYRLSGQYPSYFLTSELQGDWTRLTPETREFVNALHTIIHLASSATNTNILPSGYYRVYRHGYMHLVTKVHDLTLVVLAKRAYLESLGSVNDVS